MVLRDPKHADPLLQIAVLLHLKRVCDRVSEWVRERVRERAGARVKERNRVRERERESVCV